MRASATETPCRSSVAVSAAKRPSRSFACTNTSLPPRADGARRRPAHRHCAFARIARVCHAIWFGRWRRKLASGNAAQSRSTRGDVDALAHELLQRRVAARSDARVRVRRPLEPGAQRIARRDVEIGEQLILPRVPQLRIGAGDVGDRQQVQMIEPFDVLDLHREAMHDVGIGDVLSLRGDAHHEMPAHQPCDRDRCRRREGRACAQNARASSSPSTEWSPPRPFAMSWNSAASSSSSGLCERAPDRRRDRKFGARCRIGEARDVAQHAQRVLVDRVDMEQVVLHAPDDAPERRQQRREHAVAIHRGERLDRRRTAAQQREERGQHVSSSAKSLPCRASARCSRRIASARKAAQLRMIEQQRERLDHRARAPLEQVGGSRLEARADGDEIAVDLARRSGRRIEQLLEALGDLRAEPLDDRRGAVVALHELLDAEILLVLVAEAELGARARADSRTAGAPRRGRRPGAARSDSGAASLRERSSAARSVGSSRPCATIASKSAARAMRRPSQRTRSSVRSPPGPSLRFGSRL